MFCNTLFSIQRLCVGCYHCEKFIRRVQTLPYEPADAYRDTPCSDPQKSTEADQTPDEPSQQMLLMSETVMEKRTETSQHSSRSGRVKREPSPSAKERKTKAPKSVKLQEPHKRKEKPEVPDEEEDRGEAKEAQIISSSTVVNVDSVRERIKEDREELLGLLETEGP